MSNALKMFFYNSIQTYDMHVLESFSLNLEFDVTLKYVSENAEKFHLIFSEIFRIFIFISEISQNLMKNDKFQTVITKTKYCKMDVLPEDK